MGEVLLRASLPGADARARSRFAKRLRARRWEPLSGQPGVFSCYFEHGFIGEVRRIVHNDVEAAADGVDYRAAHAWCAAGHERLEPASPSQTAPPRAPAQSVWTDGGAPVGPLADVLLTLALSDPEGLVGGALGRLGWIPIDGVPMTFRRVFDLGMFEPLRPRVEADVQRACALAEGTEWRGAYAQSTFECTRLEGPPRARAIRPLPWDRER